MQDRHGRQSVCTRRVQTVCTAAVPLRCICRGFGAQLSHQRCHAARCCKNNGACAGQHAVTSVKQHPSVAVPHQFSHVCVSLKPHAGLGQPSANQRSRFDPAALCVPQRVGIWRQAAGPGGICPAARSRCGPVQALRFQDGWLEEGRLEEGREPQRPVNAALQHAAGVPVLPLHQQGARLLQREPDTRARQAGAGAVIGRHVGCHQTHWHA